MAKAPRCRDAVIHEEDGRSDHPADLLTFCWPCDTAAEIQAAEGGRRAGGLP